MNGQEMLQQIDKFLERYTTGEYYQYMLEAKEDYFKRTGSINEDSPDFEAKMHCFNEWYLFNYRVREQATIFQTYLNSEPKEKKISIDKINYSLFLFHKKNWKKKAVLKDILHGKKVTLSNELSHLNIIEGDLFVGRVVTYEDEDYLLNGICSLPPQVLNIVKKQAKKVSIEESSTLEEKFLLKLELLRTKMRNYSHVSPEKIFSQDL